METVCRRPCVKLRDESGKEVIYRWYDDHQQAAKWNGPRYCEHCGVFIETWQFFKWRFWGLCDACYSKGEEGLVPDDIVAIADPDDFRNTILTVAKPGGRDDSPETVAQFERRVR